MTIFGACIRSSGSSLLLQIEALRSGSRPRRLGEEEEEEEDARVIICTSQ